MQIDKESVPWTTVMVLFSFLMLLHEEFHEMKGVIRLSTFSSFLVFLHRCLVSSQSCLRVFILMFKCNFAVGIVTCCNNGYLLAFKVRTSNA